MLYKIIISFFILILLPDNQDYNNKNDAIKEYSVYIIKHDWHTGIVLRKDTSDFCLFNEFPEYEYIEIGWGDKDFYMAEKETVWLALKAALWPTESVIHVSAFNLNPEKFYAGKTVAEIKLAVNNYLKLIEYINTSLQKTNDGKLVPLGKYNKVSSFYLSTEKYHVFKTCNVWTAKALKNAGVAINPSFCLTSKGVIKRLEKNQ